jgi:hypothetical protein
LRDRRRFIRSSETRDERLYLALGQRAGEAVDGSTVGECVYRRDRLDTEGLGELGIFVDVDLYQLDPTICFMYRLLQRGPQLLARTAPRRPKIDHYRRLMRCVDHVGLEAASAAFLDDVSVTRGGADDGFHDHVFPDLFYSNMAA